MAIDLAGGIGSGALYLAAQGFDAVLIDVSDVGLSRAETMASERNLIIRSLRLDLEGLDLATVLRLVAETAPAEPASVSVVTCFHYLNRPLLESVVRGLPPGAVFLASIATQTNLEQNPRPSARFLLEPGELERLVCGPDGAATRSQVEILHLVEEWTDRGTHEAEIAIRKRE